MKKILLAFSIGLALTILGFSAKSNHLSMKEFSLFQEAQACTASTECTDGAKVSCSGSVWCSELPFVGVLCDGNQQSYCY